MMENTNNAGTVTISVERFEELLDLETRVKVAVEKIVRHNYISTEDLLFTLGTGLALMKAEELREESKKYEEELKSGCGLSFAMMLEEENGERN